MRRSASEVIRDLEMRVANLEGRKTYTKKLKSPVMVQLPLWKDEFHVVIWCPKSEIKNIEGFGHMHNGVARTSAGSLGPRANPMMCTAINFRNAMGLDKFLESMSRTYSLIESI